MSAAVSDGAAGRRNSAFGVFVPGRSECVAGQGAAAQVQQPTSSCKNAFGPPDRVRIGARCFGRGGIAKEQKNRPKQTGQIVLPGSLGGKT